MEERLENPKKFASGFCFYKVFWIFIIACFLGDVHEVLLHFLKYGEWVVRRGVIYGPFNPVYGFGAVLIYITMYKIKDGKIIFLLGSMIGGCFEFLCSLIQEYMFGTISWDYSSYFLNFGGRTSLFHMICWGAIAVLFLKFCVPFVDKIVESFPLKMGTVVTWLFIIFMVFDMSISLIASRRQFARHKGIEPRNAFERRIDEIYTDERLKKAYPNTMEID